jgi:hypothetical protein
VFLCALPTAERQALFTVFRFFTCVGMIAAITSFYLTTDFAAVLAGILCMALFMMSFLPIASDRQP